MGNFSMDALFAMQRLGNPSLLGMGTLQQPSLVPSSFSSGPAPASYYDNHAAALYQHVLNEQQRHLSSGLVSNHNNMIGGAFDKSAVVPSYPGPPTKSVDAASAAAADLVQSKLFDSTVTAPSRRRKANFAEKLHAILSNQACRHAIAWLPSGRSFSIVDQTEFTKTVLPKHFREAKFESFSRRLKRWGFRKVYTTGMAQSIFSHDLFHRDHPELCKVMNGRDRQQAPVNMSSMNNVPSFVPEDHTAVCAAADDLLLQRADVYRQQNQQQRAVAAALLNRHPNCNPQQQQQLSPSAPAVSSFERITSSPGSMCDQSRRQSISDELASCEARLKVLQQMKAEVTVSSSRVRSASPRGLSH